MTLYRDYQPALHPTALAGPYGVSWGASQGTMKDRVVTLAVDAVTAGLVLRCPADALPLLGADVALEQLPDEADDSFRTRIAGAWETWRWAGTRTAIETILVQLVVVSYRVSTAHDLGRLPWAQWWAIVTLPHTPSRRTWGAPEAWGDGIWGSNVDRATVRRVRRLLRQFMNARDRGWVVIRLSSPAVWGAPGKWGTGTWGGRNPRWRI